MSILKQYIRIPLSKKHNENTSSNNVCRNSRETSICSPICRSIDITNFNNFQVINTSDLAISQRNKDKSKYFTIDALPKNSRFSLKSIHRRNSCQTNHQNSPSKSCSRGTSFQAFQIPKVLRTCIFLFSRAITFLHQQSPNTEVNKNIQNHIRPENTQSSIGRRRKNKARSRIKRTSLQIWTQEIVFNAFRTQGHQKQPHMTNTTIGKQTLQCSLCLRRNSSNNHRSSSKKSQCTSKGTSPNSMPMMSPKSKNCNFRLKSNPQRYTRPCTLVNIRNPKMQRCCCLFPKKSCRNKPNSKGKKLRRFTLSSLKKIFERNQICFTCMPINKTNSLKQQTTSKSTQQKVFHCSFKRICTLRIQSTENNQRKTLQFHSQINRHLICCENLQILTKKCQHCKIDVFSVTNRCNFLPSLSNSLHKSTCSKQKNTQAQAVSIFLERSTLHNPEKRTVFQQKNEKQTPDNCPQSQSRNSMIWTSACTKFSFRCRSGTETAFRNADGTIHFSENRVVSLEISESFFSTKMRNCIHFGDRCNKISCSVPLQNKKTKHHKKFRSKKNQIQSHFFLFFFKTIHAHSLV